MRFLLVTLAWVVFVGGLFFYTASRDAGVSAGAGTVETAAAQAAYAIEITTTFALEEDPFALTSDAEGEPPLDLRLNGRQVAVPIDKVRRGLPLQLEGVEGVVRGRNEIHIKASPPMGETLDHGVRIRLFEDGAAIADATVWGSRGALVSGTVPFTVTEEEGEHGHE